MSPSVQNQVIQLYRLLKRLTHEQISEICEIAMEKGQKFNLKEMKMAQRIFKKLSDKLDESSFVTAFESGKAETSNFSKEETAFFAKVFGKSTDGKDLVARREFLGLVPSVFAALSFRQLAFGENQPDSNSEAPISTLANQIVFRCTDFLCTFWKNGRQIGQKSVPFPIEGDGYVEPQIIPLDSGGSIEFVNNSKGFNFNNESGSDINIQTFTSSTTIPFSIGPGTLDNQTFTNPNCTMATWYTLPTPKGTIIFNSKNSICNHPPRDMPAEDEPEDNSDESWMNTVEQFLRNLGGALSQQQGDDDEEEDPDNP